MPRASTLTVYTLGTFAWILAVTAISAVRPEAGYSLEASIAVLLFVIAAPYALHAVLVAQRGARLEPGIGTLLAALTMTTGMNPELLYGWLLERGQPWTPEQLVAHAALRALFWLWLPLLFLGFDARVRRPRVTTRLA
jgi:hypothetical protein